MSRNKWENSEGNLEKIKSKLGNLSIDSIASWATAIYYLICSTIFLAFIAWIAYVSFWVNRDDNLNLFLKFILFVFIAFASGYCLFVFAYMLFPAISLLLFLGFGFFLFEGEWILSLKLFGALIIFGAATFLQLRAMISKC